MDIRDRIVEFTRVPAGELHANPRNWRKHPKEQRQALRTLLSQIGFAGAALVRQTDDGSYMLIDGHLRQEEVDHDMPVPVLVTDLSAEEADTVLWTFDPLGALAETDKDALYGLLIEPEDDPLSSLAETVADLYGIDLGEEEEVKADPGARIDEAEVLQEKWQVKPGQVWQIGRHRLMCGDSTKSDDVALLLGGEIPRIMVTDPPYGVEYDQEWRSQNRVGRVTNDDNASWLPVWELSPATVAYVWHASRHANVVFTDLLVAGYEHRAQIIWNKTRHVFSQGHYHWKHEPCFYAVKKGGTAEWIGDRTQNTVWDIAADTDAPGNHSTQKPVECMARPIRNHAGDVYDPFTGSGTTLVACEQTGRRGYGMEIAEKYCAVILERLVEMGLEAAVVEGHPAAI